MSEHPDSSTLFICGFQESLWSIVSPKYLTSVTYFIFFPYNFIGWAICLPDLWKIMANVFSGLKVKLHLLPHFCNWLSNICKVFVMWLRSFAPLSMHRSSANPCPIVPHWFIISTALLKAIIQNLAEQTPPCGNPMSILTSPLYPPISAVRFLWIR